MKTSFATLALLFAIIETQAVNIRSIRSQYSDAEWQMPPSADPTFWDKNKCKHTYISPKTVGDLGGWEDETELECPGTGANKDKALGDKYEGSRSPAAQEKFKAGKEGRAALTGGEDAPAAPDAEAAPKPSAEAKAKDSLKKAEAAAAPKEETTEEGSPIAQ